MRSAALGEARAEGHLRRAVELIDETDMSPWRVDARVHLARWLADQGSDEAAIVARHALDIAEAKEATVLADQARRILSERGTL